MHPSMPVEEARKIADERGSSTSTSWGSGKIMSEFYDDSSEHLLLRPTFVMATRAKSRRWPAPTATTPN